MKLRAAVVVLAILWLQVTGHSALVSRSQDQGQDQNNQPPAASQPQTEPTPPPAASQPQTEPAPPPQSPAPVPPQQTNPEATPPQASAPTTPEKRKAVRKKRKPAAKSETSTQSGKVVVRNGGTSDTSSQLAPGMSQEQAQHQRETTIHLLAITDTNLKSVAGRQLNPAQQNMFDQINTYVRQAKAANESGDIDRAHTLAFKAHLLSDELAHK